MVEKTSPGIGFFVQIIRARSPAQVPRVARHA